MSVMPVLSSEPTAGKTSRRLRYLIFSSFSSLMYVDLVAKMVGSLEQPRWGNIRGRVVVAIGGPAENMEGSPPLQLVNGAGRKMSSISRSGLSTCHSSRAFSNVRLVSHFCPRKQQRAQGRARQEE